MLKAGVILLSLIFLNITVSADPRVNHDVYPSINRVIAKTDFSDPCKRCSQKEIKKRNKCICKGFSLNKEKYKNCLQKEHCK